LGVVTTSNKRAEKASEMTGNPRKHVEVWEQHSIMQWCSAVQVVRGLASKPCVGEPSLQNGLELCVSSLRHMPPHASREVIVVMGSLTTCDPGDINKTIEAAKQCKVRCSVINLSAEVRIYRELARETGGLHNVILDDLHFKDLLAAHLDPPASAAAAESSLIRMGFPSHAGREGETPGLGMCLCHLDTAGDEGRRISTAGYCCPQCSAKYCELPVECRGCGLTLVSAPHLARSYHHLFPLPPFQEVEGAEAERVRSAREPCAACGQPFPASERLLHRCPQCQQVVCTECDLFIHETLHTCPGCAGRPGQRAATPGTLHLNGNGAAFNGSVG
jgi:transcription initiation factor TFIIH subunit 2